MGTIQGLREPLLVNNRGSLEIWRNSKATAQKMALIFGLALPLLCLFTAFVGTNPNSDLTGSYILHGLLGATIIGLAIAYVRMHQCNKQIEALRRRPQQQRLVEPIEMPKVVEPKKEEPISIAEKVENWPIQGHMTDHGPVMVVTNPDNPNEQYLGAMDHVNRKFVWYPKK